MKVNTERQEDRVSSTGPFMFVLLLLMRGDAVISIFADDPTCAVFSDAQGKRSDFLFFFVKRAATSQGCVWM